jgi:hypothetical protein
MFGNKSIKDEGGRSREAEDVLYSHP